MMGWVDIVNVAATVTGLAVAVLCLAATIGFRYVPSWDRRFLTIFFSVLVAYVASSLGDQIALVQGPACAPVSRAFIFLESFFSSALVPLVVVYFLRCAGEDWRGSRLMRVVLGLWGVYLVLLGAAQLTSAIYYVTDGNVYHRGPLYPVLLVPPALAMAIGLVGIARRRQVLSRRERAAFTTYLALPLACALFQMAFYGLLAIVVGTSLGAMAMLGFILMDLSDEYVARREEAARQRAALMALQMRPHFIYNVMTSIYYLCGQDPEAAQQVTLDFTNYLRANFAAVVKEGMVPFAEELDHTRAYLAVESARFEGRLEVELDCPHMGFRLPPLTLQPLVENAVKHGVDPELPPLEVRVSSWHEDGRSLVVVEDTGPGFDVGAAFVDPASALANVRERLEAAGCSLEISAREGGGTRAVIAVPDGESRL